MHENSSTVSLPLTTAKMLETSALASAVVALSLSLYDTVARQQHAQILQMAITTAAATAILGGKKAEAEALLQLAESKAVSPNLDGLLGETRAYLDSVREELNKLRG